MIRLGENRRAILRGAVGVVAAGILPDTAMQAFARGGAGRTVVYLYQFGAADTHNLLVPLEGSSYQDYARARGPLALAEAELLVVRDRATQARYGFHPALTGVARLFEDGAAAVVADVGDPSRAAADFHRHSYPRLRFIPNGYAAPRWTGLESGDDPVYAGDSELGEHGITRTLPGRQFSPGSALRSARLETAFPATVLGRKLEQIALEILAGEGASSQVFFCGLDGFDTHTRQLERQANLYRELGSAISAFYDFTKQAGISELVTLATATEFGRSPAHNGKGGTEHGWGSHRLVAGGDVIGGRVYGGFPGLDAAVAAPSISEDLFDATLAGWAGFSYPEIQRMFPSLTGASSPSLGFLA